MEKDEQINWKGLGGAPTTTFVTFVMELEFFLVRASWIVGSVLWKRGFSRNERENLIGFRIT